MTTIFQRFFCYWYLEAGEAVLASWPLVMSSLLDPGSLHPPYSHSTELYSFLLFTSPYSAGQPLTGATPFCCLLVSVLPDSHSPELYSFLLFTRPNSSPSVRHFTIDHDHIFIFFTSLHTSDVTIRFHCSRIIKFVNQLIDYDFTAHALTPL
jgi:hypothetical protein